MLYPCQDGGARNRKALAASKMRMLSLGRLSEMERRPVRDAASGEARGVLRPRSARSKCCEIQCTTVYWAHCIEQA